MDYKQAFFSKLEDCYLGVRVKNFHQKDLAKAQEILQKNELESSKHKNKDELQKARAELESQNEQQSRTNGFSNLMQIKYKYFTHIKAYLEKEIDAQRSTWDKNDIYNKLFTFFDSYLNDTGTPFFTDTPIYKNIYAKIYSNSKDTSLFYKTQNLYYVKSDTLYQSLILSDENENYEVVFDTSECNQNADNTKNKIIFKFAGVSKGGDTNKQSQENEDFKANTKSTDNEENKIQILIKITNQKDLFPELSKVFKDNSSELSEDFLKDLKHNEILKESKIKISEDELKKIFRAYKKQQEIDFFIHKDAKSFLEEQFDLWMFNHLYKEQSQTQWDTHSIQRLQTIRKLAFDVIRLIAAFENELKALWLKPKFAKKTQYVFSLDVLLKHCISIEKAKNLLELLTKNKGFAAQIAEWQELNLIDESFPHSTKEQIEMLLNDEKYRFLPLDTKHFEKATRYAILSCFENLDEVLNGELIKADNFQALNTLMPKYQGKIDLIYIDPPYNAPASEIIYKNNFKDSTWLSMMENRLRLGKEFLSKRGIFTCAIDENEQENLGLLLSDIFYEYEKTCVSVEHNPKGIQGDNFSYSNEFAYFLIPQDAEIQNEIMEMQYKELMKTGKESERLTAKNCFYPIYVKDTQIIGFGEVCKDDFHPKQKIIYNGNFIEIYPIDSNGNERKWRYSRESIEKIRDNLKAFKTKNSITIKLGKTEKSFKTMWYGAKYSATEYGSKILKDITPHNEFDYPKSIHTVKDSIYLASKEDSIIMDFFGGSGTTAHAVLELNKEGSNRKFILVEQGEHFYSVIIPRIKKVAFSSEWKGGKLKNDKQSDPINIAFSYYELESYEEALKACEYVLDSTSNAIFDYKKSRKLIKGA